MKSFTAERVINMLNFPSKTEVNKRIPKQKFYENLDISPALKRVFIDYIKQIVWANNFSPDTLSISKGEGVNEIQVFHILLQDDLPDENVLKQIDREIPYYILFILELDGKLKASIGYKEATVSGNAAFKVAKYYSTFWQKPEDLSIDISAPNMDILYESVVRQIAGERLHASGETLKESFETSEKIVKLQKEIEKLEKLAWTEKQPKKKYEYSERIKKLKDEVGLI